jgi:hypothetical protein
MALNVDKAQWTEFLTNLSRAIAGKRAEIEIASLDLGDQIQAEWLPLLGMSYDPKDDLIEIALEGLDHLIRHPVRLMVESEGLHISSIEVVDAGGLQQLVRLRDPLMLPAPER